MIAVRNLKKCFGPVMAVEDVTFDAPDGVITGLLGANGAGKSTTLRMICGVLQPDGGCVRMDHSLGALLDHAGLYPRLTARENIAYYGRLCRMNGKDLDLRVNEVVAQLGLRTVADRYVAGFSQGERMKVALGRALVHRPGNILLDEPTNGLDVPAVRALRAVLRDMRDAGLCIIFSTHVLEEVRALCDKVVIIAHGRVAAQGTPMELIRDTRSASLEDAFVKLSSPEEEAVCPIS